MCYCHCHTLKLSLPHCNSVTASIVSVIASNSLLLFVSVVALCLSVCVLPVCRSCTAVQCHALLGRHTALYRCTVGTVLTVQLYRIRVLQYNLLEYKTGFIIEKVLSLKILVCLNLKAINTIKLSSIVQILLTAANLLYL